jgi:hypothetical protein
MNVELGVTARGMAMAAVQLGNIVAFYAKRVWKSAQINNYDGLFRKTII